MKTIWKYDVSITNSDRLACVVLDIPTTARILTLETQNGISCLWVELDTTDTKTRRVFQWYGTGQPLPENPGVYIGTVLVASGTLVFHLYETTHAQ